MNSSHIISIMDYPNNSHHDCDNSQTIFLTDGLCNISVLLVPMDNMDFCVKSALVNQVLGSAGFVGPPMEVKSIGIVTTLQTAAGYEGLPSIARHGNVQANYQYCN